ncbi:MAG TPA: hypothetical protein VKU85_05595, partial [bacterium]|nr:hypothetical protein [bacterium]
ADLADVVAERIVAADEIVLSALDPGEYSWSAASVRGGESGGWAPSRSLVLRRDEEAPRLSVRWPEGVVQRKSLRLSGITEPGAQVFAGMVPVGAGPDGRFEIEVDLTRGANHVVVESVDDAGNSAYETRMITALY